MTDETTSAPTTETETTKPLSLLAGEMFGADYHGPKPEESASEAAETPEETPPEGETTPEADVAEETTETEDGTASEAETSETEEETASTLAEVIEANGWDPEWANTLKVPVKVDGAPAEATIADLVKSYQMGEAADKRLEDAKTKARAITEEAGQVKQAFESQLSVVAKLIEQAEKTLDQEVATLDPKLREDDPGEYAARKSEIDERRRSIEQLKRDAAASVNKATEGQRAELRERQVEYLREQQTLLLSAIPAWRDEDTATTEKAELVTYLVGQGFEQADVMNAADHRLVVMGRKAMLYDKSQAKTDVAKKKVAKVPKVLKPGAPRPKEQISRERIGALEKQLRNEKSPQKQDDIAVALLQARRGAK